MNTQIVNVPARGTGQKAHVRQEHPGDGPARSSHLDSLPAAPHTPFSAQGQPLFWRLRLALFPFKVADLGAGALGKKGRWPGVAQDGVP